MKHPLFAVGAVLLLSLTACASGGTVADQPSSSSSRPPFQTTSPGPLASPVASGTPTEVPPARWDAIVDDLEKRGVSGAPTPVSALAVTWNSGALGCPQPGMSYTQSLVEGMQVIVEVDGTTYDYRFGRGDSPLLCGG